MPAPPDKPGAIGSYWLSQNRHGTWCRTWFDTSTKQTRRESLGVSSFETARLRLARWAAFDDQVARFAAKLDPSDLSIAAEDLATAIKERHKVEAARELIIGWQAYLGAVLSGLEIKILPTNER